MNSQLKQPLVLTAIGATLAVAVVYAAVPLFSIPLFGFSYGWEYVATFFKIGKYLEMVPFLMPFIGLAGTAATLVTKSRRDSGFQIFYVFINIGGLVAPFVAPLLREGGSRQTTCSTTPTSPRSAINSSTERL